MQPLEYDFRFETIGQLPTKAIMSSEKDGQVHSFQISIDPPCLDCSVTNFVDTDLARDLLGLAAAVHAADWLSWRRRNQAVVLRLAIPVRRIELFQRPDIDDGLRRILGWLTGDRWSFEWQKCQESEPSTYFQRQLPFGRPKELCLWSGGLDACLGLLHRFQNSPEKDFLLIGTGGNDCVLGIQRQLAGAVRPVVGKNSVLKQSPIQLEGASAIRKNSGQRSRGFVFQTVGSVAAYLQGEEELHVHENGVGALNLPYTACEVELDHARAVHPKTLHDNGSFISTLIGRKFRIVNSFQGMTKGEMTNSLRDVLLRFPELVSISMSCDSPHRQKDQPIQCGYCSSCLLRRNSLLVAHLKDDTRYALFNGHAAKPHDSVALGRMGFQARKIASSINSAAPWHALVQQYPLLVEAWTDSATRAVSAQPDLSRDNIVTLLGRYAEEWLRYEHALEENLRPA